MASRQKPIRRISLLGICSGLGQMQKGLEAGPSTLRENGICDIFSEGDADFFDLGDLKPEQNENQNGWILIERVRAKAFQSLQDGQLLFSLGGDHSISIGTVQATLMAYPNARLIWIDAHGDINTPETSPTGNLHGMPLAALLGLFKTPIGGPLLSPKRLLVVGVRDLDPAEKIFFDELNIDFISATEILSHPAAALERIGSWLKQESENPIHLSFDIDALDPSFAPATGIRVPLGLSVEFANRLVSLIAFTGQIVSVDLVELNPQKAESQHELDQTIHCAKSIISSAIANLQTKEYEL